ncbi:MAG: sigma-70 family RNA polymerase sigma factor [Bryobacteraceae bacterium]
MQPADSSDSDLIERLRKRDPDGLAAAYERYGHVTYSLFVRITRDQGAAEDLVQELFIRLWNRAREFDSSRGALGVWILSIARNMAIDHVRSAQARFATRVRSLDHIDQLCFSKNPTDPVSRIDSVRTLKGAFEKLNANEKRVMELAYFEGFSQSEIAARIQEPLGTVKSWMRSALSRLRAAVKGAETT